MTRRPILVADKSGDISRGDARKAAKAVKTAKSKGAYAKKLPWKGRGDAVTLVRLERYLGHFGPVAKRSKVAAKKTSPKKRPSKKSVAKRSYRRAS